MGAYILVLAFFSLPDMQLMDAHPLLTFQTLDDCEAALQPTLIAATLLLPEDKLAAVKDSKQTLRVACIEGQKS